MKKLLAFAAASLFAMGVGHAEAGPRLDAIKKAQLVKCAVSGTTAGMSLPNEKGEMVGFDVDLCRAFAAAVLGDSKKVQVIPTNTQTRFTGLQSGEYDSLFMNAALTLNRDSALGLTIAVRALYSGQAFLVKKSLGIDSALKLAGGTACVKQGTEIERNIVDWAAKNKISIKTLSFDSTEAANSAFYSDRCDAVSTDLVNLQTYRLRAPNPGDYIVLPEIVAKEPEGILVANGDVEWEKVVRWTVYCLIQAEEFGITKANVKEMLETSQDPKIRRFLGLDAKNGEALGIPNDWTVKVIEQVGNYGELFDEHLGAHGLGMDRGLNKLWTDGGLLISDLFQ